MPDFYAIRQKSTGFLVPSGGKGIRGHTWQEPSKDKPPRLHTRLQLAKAALNCYLEGKWREYASGPDHNGEYDHSGPEPQKNTERDKNDFEVVKVKLEVQDA